MKLQLQRHYKGADYTIGRLYIDGVYYCDTLEDKVRKIEENGTGKIQGVTAINAGQYTVRVTYSPKMKRLLPYLVDVPHFEGIRIHAGNTAKDTEGCILVGYNKVVGRLLDSRKTEEKITKLLLAAQDAGEKITIEIV